MTTAKEIYQPAQINYAIDFLDNLPTEIEIPLFSQWAAENRVLPPGTSEYYGKFDPLMVPHLIQPLDDCHPDSPYTHITNIKSVQSANTVTLAENALGAYIRYKLGSVLFLTSTKTMAGIRGSSNIDTMIDHSGLAEYLKPASNRTGKKSKDNTLYKEFAGGIKLLMTSYNSIADLKSNTFHLIIEDELDEAGTELKDQGDIEGIIEGRTMGLLNYKILQISTSGRAETSRIYRNFLQGDQNEYFVPCPICGHMQMLVLKKRGEEHGLTATYEKTKTGSKRLLPETVRYVCIACAGEFRESKKYQMLIDGKWIPQAVPDDPLRRSYHSPGLISPFLGWNRIMQQFLKAGFGQELMIMKDFTINYLGNPWMDIKASAKWESLKARAEDYVMGKVPKGKQINISGVDVYDGPLLLYSGCDVQGDRLELITVGFGINGNKWIVDKQIFFGDTKNIDDPCWYSLHNYVYEKEFMVCGKPVTIGMCAIDAGWDPRKAEKRNKDYAGKSHVVYEFVSQRVDRFIATMGSPDDKATGILKESKITDTNTSLTKRYLVAVSLLKEMIMAVIEQSEGFNTIHVPKWSEFEGQKILTEDEFFMQFLSERFQEDPKKPGHYGWFKLRNRNEVLDNVNYAIAASSFHNIQSWTIEAWSEYYYSLIGDD